MLVRILSNPKAVPGSNAIAFDFASRNTLLEGFKSPTESSVKLIGSNEAQLRLRIVNVINVHAVYSEILQRLLQLILQIRWGHAVTAAHNVFESSDAGTHKCILNVAADVSWRPAVKGQVSSLCTDQQLFSGKVGFFGERA